VTDTTRALSSSGHLFSPVVFDDLGFDFIPYTPIVAYGRSKTANALLAIGIRIAGLAMAFAPTRFIQVRSRQVSRSIPVV
jgi:hypothetical protein